MRLGPGSQSFEIQKVRMTSTLVFVASAAEHPLLDIDWTGFVQFGIFVLTAVIATALLFKPYLAMRDRRAASIEGARGEAAQMIAEADGKLVSYDRDLAAARNRANEERRKVRAEAAAHQREVTERARAESVAALEQAKSRVATETATARAQLMPRADQLAGEIAARLLGRKVA
jgi:F-type H+-transporting ATPase subunit b